MKIPSLIKIPKHQRFHIEPRYYDPVKEEIEQRTSRIKKELELEQNDISNPDGSRRTPIAGSFAGRYNKREKLSTSGMLQFLLIIVLLMSFVGYLYIGNTALYLLGIFLLLFVYLKFRNIF